MDSALVLSIRVSLDGTLDFAFCIAPISKNVGTVVWVESAALDTVADQHGN